MKIELKRISVIIFCILILLTIIILNFYLKDSNRLFYSTGTDIKAFLNSTWEMSPNEINRVNETTLQKPNTSFIRFLPDAGIPHILKRDRYHTLEQIDINIWGNSAKVEYGFFDNKLFQYSLSVTAYSDDYNKISNNIINQLENKYGKGKSIKHKYFLVKLEWITDILKIEYWIYKNDKENKYSINVQYEYIPMLNKIGEISEREIEKIF